MDPEIKAMSSITEALAGIEDPEARLRVLRWANEKFGFTTGPTRSSAGPAKALAPLDQGGNREIAGIAMLSEAGEFRLTVRDVKARSAVDAAMRLTHIAIRAHEQLTGEKSISSKTILVPLLKGWRVYDGNSRYALSQHKGIIRNGDSLELDFHAQAEADRYIEEVLDASVESGWKPGQKAKLKRRVSAEAESSKPKAD